MGVYIDMEMPKEGFVEILICDDGTVQQTGQSYRIGGTDYYTPYVGEMPVMYKAVPIQPHGRLIDADAMEYEEAYLNGHYELGDVEIVTRKDIESAPTIIPASEEGET